MLKGGMLTDADREEAVKLQRRQLYEDERKKRIFNSKARSIGLDNAALEKQIFEKKQLQNIEDECDRVREEQTMLQKQVLFKRCKDEEKAQKQIAKNIDYFRCKFQKPEMRSEYDLNDPLALRKAKPLRTADDDITLGISSAQVFEGEDIGKSERLVKQREQQRAWLQQQMQERKAALESKKKADKLMDESAYSRDQHLGELAYSYEKIRFQVGQDVNKYNQEVARLKEAEKKKLKKETEEDNLAEIYNMVTSDMLSENRNAGASATDPSKKVAYMYRGMTPEEAKIFKEMQYKQVLERRKHREDLEIIEKQWEQYAINMDRELRLKEIELERREKELTRDMNLFNEKLAKTQIAQKIKSNKELGTNIITDEFYNQFNKESR